MISGTALKIMLQSFIGDDGMRQIDELIASGTIGKIAEFADHVEEFNQRLARIEQLLAASPGPADAGPLSHDGAGMLEYHRPD